MIRLGPASFAFLLGFRKVLLCAAAIALLLTGASLGVASQSYAQGARHPFAVGADEGAATTADPVSRFILVLEGNFYRLLTGAVRSAKEGGLAAWGLVALSFAYGVIHAAGPGHGKAVIASYLVANEKTFLRGVAISAAAALLQGSVAVATVGTAAVLFQATAKQMTNAARVVEIASYAGIAILGCLLVYKKGKALLSLRRTAALVSLEPAFAAAVAPLGTARRNSGKFLVTDTPDHEHGPSCGHFYAFDPSATGATQVWRTAALTVLAAGLRPCSGAILVLVFSLAQGALGVGILSVAAMSLGTAITTSALAALAVFAKKTAVKLAAGSKRSLLIGRVIEATAAVGVLALGLVLLVLSVSTKI